MVPVVRLTEVFRQAAHSRIIRNAHRINEGSMPELAAKNVDSDFFFVDRDEPEAIASTLVEMVKTRIPAKFRVDPIRDIQVLCPMNRGSLGIREFNTRLQAELNPARADEPVVEKFGWKFHVRDKIIQTVNNYTKEVFNGDKPVALPLLAESKARSCTENSRSRGSRSPVNCLARAYRFCSA